VCSSDLNNLSGPAAQPQAPPPAVLRKARKYGGCFRRMAGAHIIRCPHDLESVIVLEECAHEILFVPIASLVNDPPLGVFIGQEYVVNMDQHAWLQPRQYFENQIVHVAPGLSDVRAVNEKDVMRTQPVKE